MGIFDRDNQGQITSPLGPQTSGGSGANQTLSNLTSPTAINQDLNLTSTFVVRLKNTASFISRNALDNADIPLLWVDAFNRTNIAALSGQNILFNNNIIPAAADTISMGVVGDAFSNIVTNKLEICQSGSSIGQLDFTSTSPSGSGTGLSVRTNDAARNLFLFTQNSAVADANPTRDILIETGNKSAGTGGSGNIKLRPGTSSGGTRGNIIGYSNIIPDIANNRNIGATGNAYQEATINLLRDNTGGISYDTAARQISDSSGGLSVDGEVRKLIAEDAIDSIRYGTARALVDHSNIVSFDWDTRVGSDSSGNLAIQFANNRYLHDAAEIISNNWGSRQLNDTAGTMNLDYSTPGLVSVTSLASAGDVSGATVTPANGATGTFTTVDLKTVTVTNGIITLIA